MKQKKNIEEFLQETIFCDFKHPLIQNTISAIVRVDDSDREKAIKFFYWVRDNILYSVGRWKKKASETLKKKEGTCTNAANLLVAFLRASGIPAGYGIMKVRGQEYFGPILIPTLKNFPSEISTHVYAVVYLNNRWIKCDPSDDQKLSKNTSYINPQSTLVEWDGRRNATLKLNKEDIVKDIYPVANIDPWMRKKVKRAKGLPLIIGNLFVKFLRTNTQNIQSIESLEVLFKKWLRRNYPFYFYTFSLYRLCKEHRIF